MAAVLPAISVAMGLFGTATQLNAAKDAKRQAAENARLAQMEAAEESRRLREQQKDVEARTRATIAASGTGMGSESQKSYLDKMKEQHQKELSWLTNVGRSRVRAERAAGRTASTSAMAGAISSLGQTASTAYSYFGPKGG